MPQYRIGELTQLFYRPDFGLRVEHIIHYSISLNVRSLVPYISHITIMCWTLNVWKGGRGITHSLYLHLPYIGCTHVPGSHPPDPCHIAWYVTARAIVGRASGHLHPDFPSMATPCRYWFFGRYLLIASTSGTAHPFMEDKGPCPAVE